MGWKYNLDSLPLYEEMYAQYQHSPHSVDRSWWEFFEQLDQTSFEHKIASAPAHLLSSRESVNDSNAKLSALVNAYRAYGHLAVEVNPIATVKPHELAILKPENYGFTAEELDVSLPTLGLLPSKQAPLRQIIEALKQTYCHRIGIEYMDLQSPELEAWLQKQIEPTQFKPSLSIDQKRLILHHLNRSELFELFLHTKYTGQKRFSLEGGETLIPMLESAIESSAALGAKEVVIGMAHRGRLNVLSNILQKSYSDIFSEFEEGYIPNSFEGSGDVKYHKGFSAQVKTSEGKTVAIILTPNPSHLEAVDSIVEGVTRAKQKLLGDPKQTKNEVIPILIHGDASVAGQGIVYETLQFSRLPGYATGGTLHLVINNHVGFTTHPREGRSTRYCTDIARAFGAPVFHVNAEDPESCVYVMNLAVALRHKFGCDVFIDINCYRKFGHNESDEPAFTQPLEYQIIRAKQPIREIYRDDLVHQGVVERAMAQALEEEFRQALARHLEQAKAQSKSQTHDPNHKIAKHKSNEEIFNPVATGVAIETLREIAKRACSIPQDFTPHPKIKQLLADRLLMVEPNSSKAIDWGMAEILAYGSLLWEGRDIRLSGQDSGRGTFSHRHALLTDQKSGHTYCPLKHLKEDQGDCDILNSPLSEYAVLGFEYGYSLAHPKALVLWEAQFGDFANGAQVIIDQFIAAAEQKWGQKNSVTLLLPHGYEGQGPEHSSARIERFLTLASHDNMLITNPTTPAQLFHLLRRQQHAPFRKPLIIFTPKGLLRLPNCVSQLEELAEGAFQEVLDDPSPPNSVEKLLFCSGRVYYDLFAERSKRPESKIAVIRLEQLYPLNETKIKEIIARYPNVGHYLWVQEEHKNMGAWNYLFPHLQSLLPRGKLLHYIGREASATPAVGSYALHKLEHAAIIQALFN